MSKIAIIGAGPSGTSLCLALLKLGVDPGDILILDRAKFPRPKLCGGAITLRGTDAIKELLGSIPGGGTTGRQQFQFGLYQLEVREPGPQWLYDRAYLDNVLLDACKERGVEVREQFHVRSLDPMPDGWKISNGQSVEKFSWVAGCDGAASVVRRVTGLPGGRIGRLMEGVFESVDNDLRADQLYFSFDPIDEGIPGYGWIFPYPLEGTTGLWKIGIMDARGVVPGSKLRSWTHHYAERNGFRPADSGLAGWPEHYFHRRNRSSLEGLVLVGEAHGIDPLLGEGIAPAIHHAMYSAGRIRRALDRGERRIRRFESDFLRSREGLNLFILQLMADRFYGADSQRWLKILFKSRALRQLGASGNVAYGRFLEHIPGLGGKLIAQLFRPEHHATRGWSPSAPQPHTNANRK